MGNLCSCPFLILLGINSPQYTDEELEQFRRENEKGIDYEGKHYTMYEATQRQRYLERSIRNRKRRILIDEATGDKERLPADQTKLVRLKDEYARFSKAANLRPQHERMNIPGFGPKQGRAADRTVKLLETKQELQNPARFRDTVTIWPPMKGDAITHRSLHNNLAKSEIGKETIEYITSGKCLVEITYDDEAPKGVRGVAIGRCITIYAKNTRTIKETAKTLIHEVTHCKYNVGGDQWAEAVCFAREHIHENGKLTFRDKRNIIITVKELYPEYKWRKRGRRNGKNKSY